jgi:hypothetical protein
MVEAEKMRVIVLVALVAACKGSNNPTADPSASATGSTSATAAASASAAAPCGTLGGSCTQEGATCSPAPIGTDWSHILSCRSGKWIGLEVAPLPQGHAQPIASARSLPKLDATCNADADCVVISDDIDGATACCPGCTQHAVSAAWNRSFRAACTASPAPSCPAIGCAMAVMKAACKAHRCELVATTK